MGRPPPERITSVPCMGVGVCVGWGGLPGVGSARRPGFVVVLSLSLSLLWIPCVGARGLVANWGFPRVRPHGRVDRREI